MKTKTRIQIWFRKGNYTIIESIAEFKDYDDIVSFNYLEIPAHFI